MAERRERSAFALQYSTLLGSTGTENGNAVARDGNGAIYIAGAAQSFNQPTTLWRISDNEPEEPRE